jgi:hypothetical protein
MGNSLSLYFLILPEWVGARNRSGGTARIAAQSSRTMNFSAAPVTSGCTTSRTSMLPPPLLWHMGRRYYRGCMVRPADQPFRTGLLGGQLLPLYLARDLRPDRGATPVYRPTGYDIPCKTYPSHGPVDGMSPARKILQRTAGTMDFYYPFRGCNPPADSVGKRSYRLIPPCMTHQNEININKSGKPEITRLPCQQTSHLLWHPQVIHYFTS